MMEQHIYSHGFLGVWLLFHFDCFFKWWGWNAVVGCRMSQMLHGVIYQGTKPPPGPLGCSQGRAQPVSALCVLDVFVSLPRDNFQRHWERKENPSYRPELNGDQHQRTKCIPETNHDHSNPFLLYPSLHWMKPHTRLGVGGVTWRNHLADSGILKYSCLSISMSKVIFWSLNSVWFLKYMVTAKGNIIKTLPF